MYRTIADFLEDWKHESESTLKLFRNMTDDSLSEIVHPKVRTLGFLSWHIVHTLYEMPAKTGINVDIPSHQDYNGEIVKQIVEAYEKGSAQLAAAIKNSWKDTDLEKTDNMYGQQWKRGVTLQILLRHQSHHRAEMLVVMRMLGLPVFGIYGPAQEEWAQMGMPAMK